MHNQIGLPKLFLVPQDKLETFENGMGIFFRHTWFYTSFQYNEDATYLLDEQRFLIDLKSDKVIGHVRPTSVKSSGEILEKEWQGGIYWEVST